MTSTRMLKVLSVLIITDLVRKFADYDSYSTLVCFFLNEVLDRNGQDEELVDRCLETLVK